MADRVTRFLGGSPLAIAVRLVVLSIAVGLVMSWLSISPAALIDRAVEAVQWLWDTAFDSVDSLFRYFLLGAAIVVPVFFIARLLSMGKR